MEVKKGKIITVTSGKGGVGKSSIVSNMAYVLSAMDVRTYILDADLALGNIDIMFGMVPKYNIRDVMEGRRALSEIVLEGPGGIRIIPATSGVSELSNLSEESKERLLGCFQDLPDYDVMVVDTSAGISSNVIYFNGISAEVIVVVTPDPASITDSYAAIKVINNRTGRKEFNIVVNMARHEEEALEIFKKILNVTDRFLDVYLNFTGHIPMDPKVNLAVRKQRLWVAQYPEAKASEALMSICRKLMV